MESQTTICDHLACDHTPPLLLRCCDELNNDIRVVCRPSPDAVRPIPAACGATSSGFHRLEGWRVAVEVKWSWDHKCVDFTAPLGCDLTQLRLGLFILGDDKHSCELGRMARWHE